VHIKKTSERDFQVTTLNNLTTIMRVSQGDVRSIYTPHQENYWRCVHCGKKAGGVIRWKEKSYCVPCESRLIKKEPAYIFRLKKEWATDVKEM
jgi:hypothetical protein